MAQAFLRSLRSLEADRFRSTAWMLLLAALILAGWLAWFLFSEVGVYELSTSARLEAEARVHPVEATVAGRVKATHLALDEVVAAGDLLVELETVDQELGLAEERSRRSAFQAQVETLQEEIRGNEEALERAAEAARLELDEARAELRQAEAIAAFAREEGRRTGLLYDEGLRSEVELLRAESEVEKTTAAVDRQRVTIGRLQEEQATRERDRRTELERLRRVANQLEGSIATSTETIHRLEHEIGERQIRAPVAGRLGEVSEIQVGGFVEKGDRLGAVVPFGEARAVAEFLPGDALGRIQPGQRAQLRLEGFPWIQFGSVPAQVTRVGSESVAGVVQVELAVNPRPDSAIPLDHGLPGTVEVEIERVPPAVLLLRVVGKLVTGTRPTTDPSENPE